MQVLGSEVSKVGRCLQFEGSDLVWRVPRCASQNPPLQD
jgi:hypothetical protein